MRWSVRTKIELTKNDDTDKYKKAISLEQLKREINSEYSDSVYRIRNASENSLLMNDEIVYVILGLLFIVGAFSIKVNFPLAMWCFIIIGVVIIARRLYRPSIEKKKENEHKLLYQITKSLEERAKDELYKVMKKHNIQSSKVKDVEIIDSNFMPKKEVQVLIDENRLMFIEIPLHTYKIIYDNYSYFVPVWKEKAEAKIKVYEKKQIESYACLGNIVTKTEVAGGGVDYGGAIIGGVLLGTAGAVIGSRQEVQSKSEQIDLREVQINLIGSKRVNIKGADIYKELILYFPRKEKK